jgi:hypothetical protein
MMHFAKRMGTKCFGLRSAFMRPGTHAPEENAFSSGHRKMSARMTHEAEWRLFNIDSLAAELAGDQSAATIDLFVASLAFKNFDFVTKRLPFLVECST